MTGRKGSVSVAVGGVGMWVTGCSFGIVGNSVCRTWESRTLAFPCAVNGVIHDPIACYPHFHAVNLLSPVTVSGQAPCGGLIPPRKAPHSGVPFLPATPVFPRQWCLPYPAATSFQAALVAPAASAVSFRYAYSWSASSCKCARFFS